MATDEKKAIKPTDDQDHAAQSSIGLADYQIAQKDVHPDPLLCRLMLNDQFGKPITTPKSYFRDCKVIGFLFSNAWKYDRDAMQNYVIELCRRNPHRFKCIYVSIDASRADFDRSTQNKPWAHMIWQDGSNEEEGKTIQLASSRFITPEESGLLKRVLDSKVTLADDPRPLSRVSLCAGREVLFSPTLAIYHLESRSWLEKNVGSRVICSPEKRERALETWEAGHSLSLTWTDILIGLRWSIIFTTLAIAYGLLVRADDSYNISHLVERFFSPDGQKPPTPAPVSSPSESPPHYVEF